MDEKPLFENSDMFEKMDAMEREFAPQELPDGDAEGARARLEGDCGDAVDGSRLNEPPAAAPVASAGSSPSSSAAAPNIGHEDHGGAPGDPETQARNPLDTDEGTRD